MNATRMAVAMAIVALSAAAGVLAQAPDHASGTVTLDWCQSAALDNSPTLAKIPAINSGERLEIAAAGTAWLPRVTLTGKYTDQSAVTKLDLPVPGLTVPEPDTNQWQVAAELSQTLWDGGLTAARKMSVRASAAADRTQVETSLHARRGQVNTVYFGLLIINEQLAQNAILREELAANESRIASWVANGVATAGDLDAVRVESLNATQARIGLEATRRALLASLSILTGAGFSEAVTFARPGIPDGSAVPPVTAVAPGLPDVAGAGLARPEAAWFAALQTANEARKAHHIAQALPRVYALAQAGYGQPGLNLFDTDPAVFWVAGLRLSWSIDGLWSLPYTLAQVDADNAAIGADRNAFFSSVQVEAARYRCEIDRLRLLLATDDELVSLRDRLKTAAKNRLDAGTIGTVDYLREINAEALARQSRGLHEIQLLEAYYALENTLNK